MATNPLHILMLADAVFEDIPGGSRVVARELARGLVARGHAVTFLVARQNSHAPYDEIKDGVRILRYPGAGNPAAFIKAGADAARKLHKMHPVDIIHTHFAYAAIGPLQALPRDIPCVRSFYGPWDAEGWVEDAQNAASPIALLKAKVKRALRHKVEADNLKRSSLAVVLSRHTENEVASFGYPPARIRLLPGGADTERFMPPLDKADVRQSLGLPADRRILFTVRRLAPRMGLDNLIKAMPSVIAEHPDVSLLIGGKGPERERLSDLIIAHQLTEHVRLIGFIPDEQLAAYYQSADAFILPTIALEGFGLVTAESLACGTPVLGTPVGATPEILSRLDPRLVLPGIAPEQLASGVNNYLANAPAWNLTPEILHAFVQENYSWAAHIDGMESVYAESLHLAARLTPRRVLYLDHTAKLGGGEIALLNLLQALDKTRVTPIVALASNGPFAQKLRAAGIETHVIPLASQIVNTRKDALGSRFMSKIFAAFLTIFYAIKVGIWAKNHGIQLIHTNSLKADLYGGLAGKIVKIPVIWHVRDSINNEYLPPIAAHWFRRLSLILPVAIIANSESTMSYIKPQGRLSTVVYSGVASVVHDGLNPESYSAAARETNLPTIALVGRIAQWKGQHIFLRAAARVLETTPGAEFWIIGAPLFGEEEYEQSLYALVKKLEIAGNVKFLGFRADVPELLQKCDIIVHASTLGEPFGQVVIEGMAAGKPVIATNGGALPEIVIPGETGLLVPMGDSESMAEAINSLLADPEKAREMGIAGRKRVAEFFAISLSAAKVHALYEQIW